MSEDLMTFLRDRLDDDERVARAAIAPGPSPRWDARTGRNIGLVSTAESGQRVASVSRAPQVEHIARHDPARVLAEVAAKRAIVTQCAEITEYVSKCGMMGAEMSDIRERDVLEDVLRLLALSYADHDSYRPEWKP